MALFEELDYAPTPLGPVSLRRRREPRLDRDVLEVLLRDEHLMSDVFTASEIALADLALDRLEGDGLRIVVGGLGLGYTARAALADARVARVEVIEYLEPVIGWHRDGLAPLGPALFADERFGVTHGDFFALVAGDGAAGDGFGAPGEAWDAVLIDIDHAPDRLLGRDGGFYTPEGLAALARHVAPGGVVSLWSDDAPDERITRHLAEAFGAADGVPVAWPNPYTGEAVTQSVYLARKAVQRPRRTASPRRTV